jgi:hypothetical protein
MKRMTNEKCGQTDQSFTDIFATGSPGPAGRIHWPDHFWNPAPGYNFI